MMWNKFNNKTKLIFQQNNITSQNLNKTVKLFNKINIVI